MTKKKPIKSLLPSSEALNEREMWNLMERLKDYFSLREELTHHEENYNLFNGDVENIIFVIENKNDLREAYVDCAKLLWLTDTKVNNRYEDKHDKFCDRDVDYNYEQALQ